jgi:hypothetical protein
MATNWLIYHTFFTALMLQCMYAIQVGQTIVAVCKSGIGKKYSPTLKLHPIAYLRGPLMSVADEIKPALPGLRAAKEKSCATG